MIVRNAPATLERASLQAIHSFSLPHETATQVKQFLSLTGRTVDNAAVHVT